MSRCNNCMEELPSECNPPHFCKTINMDNLRKACQGFASRPTAFNHGPAYDHAVWVMVLCNEVERLQSELSIAVSSIEASLTFMEEIQKLFGGFWNDDGKKKYEDAVQLHRDLRDKLSTNLK